MIIGDIYLVLLNSVGVIGFTSQHYSERIRRDQPHVNVLINYFIGLCFPCTNLTVSGYFADVWCGRYQAVIASLVLLCVALLLLCGVAIAG